MSTEFSSFYDQIRSVSSKTACESIAKQCIDSPEFLKALIEAISVIKEDRLPAKASWILTKVCDFSVHVLHPYVQTIVDLMLNTPSQPVLRSLCRVLTTLDIPESKQGLVFEFSYHIALSPKNDVAARVYSLRILKKIVTIYPELQFEFNQLLELLKADKNSSLKACLRNINK